MKIRREFKQETSIRHRIQAWIVKAGELANKLRPELDQEALLRKARLADTASHIQDWINSSGLRAPS